MTTPHEYNNVNLGHAVGYCIHCGGTPNEISVTGDLNHCPEAEEKINKLKHPKTVVPKPKITKLSLVASDCKTRSLVDALEEAIVRVKEGRWSNCNGIVIIAVENRDGKYYHGFERAGLHHSDTVTLLEVTKHSLLKEMEEE